MDISVFWYYIWLHFYYRGINYFWNVCIILPCHGGCYFQFLQTYYHPVTYRPPKWTAKNYEPSLLALSAAKGLLVTILQSCTGWGQLSFSSALKSGQFLFPLWSNFSFFVKFQAENPSQGLPKKLSYGKGMPCLWINQHWPDRVNKGKRRILSPDSVSQN